MWMKCKGKRNRPKTEKKVNNGLLIIQFELNPVTGSLLTLFDRRSEAWHECDELIGHVADEQRTAGRVHGPLQRKLEVGEHQASVRIATRRVPIDEKARVDERREQLTTAGKYSENGDRQQSDFGQCDHLQHVRLIVAFECDQSSVNRIFWTDEIGKFFWLDGRIEVLDSSVSPIFTLVAGLLQDGDVKVEQINDGEQWDRQQNQGELRRHQKDERKD